MTPALRRRPPILAWAAALLCLLLALPVLAAPKFPALTGRVVDGANLLSPANEAGLTARLQTLEDQTGRQLVVATVPSLQGYEIEEYGYQLGRAWGIGQKGQNNGALLIVAPNEKKVRVEVGYGLEPVLTDALSSVILQQRVLPRFRAGDMEGGVVSGTEALIQQLSLPEGEARARVAQAAQRPSKGGRLPGWTLILILFLLFTFLRGAARSLFAPRRRKRRGSWFDDDDDRRGGGGWGFPLIIGGGGLGGGRGFGGGFGGGGFGGGGGSFGGGGASGGW
ncbi:MAG TPA: TPM domain-containing protein [Caulobacteraceae bacterium]|jgi:uncharacterized protein